MSSSESVNPARWALLALIAFCSLKLAWGGAAGLAPLLATLVLLIVAASIVRREEIFATIALALPVEACLLVGLADGAAARWAAGAVYAASVGLALHATARNGRWPKRDAILLLLAVAAPMRLLPLSLSRSLPEILVLAGTMLLLALLPDESVSPEQLLLAFLAATVAPTFPLRASLFPAALATSVWLLLAPSPFTFAAAAMLTLASGKWSLPLLILTCVATWLRDGELRNRHHTAASREPTRANGFLALFSLTLAPLGRALATFPDLALHLRSNAARSLVLASFLATLLFRPHLALLYFVACAFLCVTLSDRAEKRLPISLIAISFVCLSLIAWSGVARTTIALAIPSTALLCVAILASAALIGPFPRLRLVVSGIVLIVGCSTFSPAAQEELTDAFALGPGESRSFMLPHPVTAFSLTASGTHMADLPVGTPIADIQVVDVEHSVFSRRILSGELSDWGFLRLGQVFQARNAIPFEPAGTVTGEAGEAWLSGDALVRFRGEKPIVGFTVFANRALTSRTRLNFRGAQEVR